MKGKMWAVGISLKVLRSSGEYSQKIHRDLFRWIFPPSDGSNDLLLPPLNIWVIGQPVTPALKDEE